VRLFAKEDNVGTKARTALTVAATTALGFGSAQAQTTLFAGVGFGFGSAYSSSTLFVGTSFGLGHHALGNEYGIYSATYDGWGTGYRGSRSYHYSRADCWDYYWDSYWDPYPSWYNDCVVWGPYHYNSFRARSWRHRYWGPRSTFVYVSDPYWAPWGPYYAYDPWAGYWGGYRDGFWDGRSSGVYDGYYYGGRVRTVYASGTASAANRSKAMSAYAVEDVLISPRLASRIHKIPSPRKSAARACRTCKASHPKASKYAIFGLTAAGISPRLDMASRRST
jgi:hypothetical protein